MWGALQRLDKKADGASQSKQLIGSVERQCDEPGEQKDDHGAEED